MTAAAESHMFKTPSQLLAPSSEAITGERLNREEATKLILRSAHQTEWEKLESGLENLESSKADSARTKQEAQERELRERIATFESAYGELFYRMFLKKLADPSFYQKSRKEQYSETAETVYGAAWQEAAKQFPNDDKQNAVGLRVLQAYASMLQESPIGSEESERLIKVAEDLHVHSTPEEIANLPLQVTRSPEMKEDESGVRQRLQSRTQRAISGVQRKAKEPPKNPVVSI